MTKEQKIYIKKMYAWIKQQELSIQDSKQRIAFFTQQEKIAKQTIAINKLQLKLDSDMVNAERRKFKKWLSENK